MAAETDRSSWRWTIGRRRLFGVAASGGAATLLAGCTSRGKPISSGNASNSASAGTPKPGGALATYIAVNPETLDPQKTRSVPAHSIVGHVLSRPFRHKTDTDPNVALSMQLENDLAISAESPDALTWTLKLRQDARFQNIAPVNGHAVEAEDVKATFVRALTIPESVSRADLLMMDATQIEAPDKNTVVFKLKYAYGPFPQTLAAASNAWVYSREAVAGTYDPAKQVIGSGPFILDSYTPDVGATFKKNPDWFDRPRPYLDSLRRAVVPDAAQQQAQFNAGNLDELTVGQNDLDTVKRANSRATVITSPAINPYQIYGHMDDPSSPFADIRIRRAISMAIDREAIGKAVFGGTYHDNGVVPYAKGKWALPPDQLGGASQYFKYNPAAAKQLVDASGAGDQLHKFVYPKAAYGRDYETIAGMINPMLNAVGIKTDLVAIDYLREFLNPTNGVAFGHYANDTLVFAILMLGGQAPEDTLFTTLTPGFTANHSRVNDPTLTTTLTKMIGTVDPDQRMKALLESQQYIADKLYYIIGIPTGNQYTVLQPKVKNYDYSLVGDAVGTETYAKLWLSA